MGPTIPRSLKDLHPSVEKWDHCQLLTFLIELNCAPLSNGNNFHSSYEVIKNKIR